MVVGTGVLIVMKQSYRTDVIYGLIYPCSLPIAMMYSGIAPYFMLKFSHWTSERRDPSKIREIPILATLVAMIVVMISPHNWFGMYRPGVNVLDIRIYTNGLLLLVNLLAVIQIIAFLFRKISREPEPIRRARIRTVLAGFIAMLGFFICYTADAMTHQPYTVWMFVAYPFAWAAIILFYLGTVAPEWYISWLKKRYK